MAYKTHPSFVGFPLPPDPTPTLSTTATTKAYSPQHAHFPGCLYSQRFPLQNNLLCTHIHLARLTTNVSLARNPSLLFHPVLNPLNILSHLSECVHACSLQSCPTLCDPMDCSPPASSVHGILQARILEWGRPALTLLPPVTLISARVFFT